MPKETAHSYKCLFDPALGPDAGVPCLQHILQDCKKLRSNYKEIHDKQGVLVPGLGSRKGHQNGNMIKITHHVFLQVFMLVVIGNH